MATYTNQTKNNSTFTNQGFGGANLTFADMTHTFAEEGGVFADPVNWENSSKTSSTFANQTKN